MTLMCRWRGHQADRGAARHDGQDYWSSCKRCQVPLIRDQAGWREPVAAEIDAHRRNMTARDGLIDDAGLNSSE